MSERDAFLRALKNNEDDVPTRMVYADWLDDQGEHEEADRQRKWPAAKEWLVRFCREHNPAVSEEDNAYYEVDLSYKGLVELAREAVEEAGEGGFIGIDCGRNETMCDVLRACKGEFWKNWAIVTGVA